ncbi:MAG: class I SAM-dependent methyltransferase [Candidatus Aenigmarchaeota archaeon]|nr:class I SAM-dependent methyltransferase [Candidatus Aenigmarchaeota archaeon]
MLWEIFQAFLVLVIVLVAGHLIDYRVLKPLHRKERKWGLNISCCDTDGGGINADVVERDIPNFVLIKDIYKLPFKNKQFDTVLCSHTIEHVKEPERFYKELQRVGKSVTILIPPIWDMLGSFLDFIEHRWLFLTFKTRHDNELPKSIKLPYWSFISWLQEKTYGKVLP